MEGATQKMPDLTTRLSNRSFQYRDVNNLSKILGIVFAPVLMQNLQKSDRDTPFRPVTIARRADPYGRPVHSGRRPKGIAKYLSWPRRRAVARLARRICEDSIWIRQAYPTQPGGQQATAHAGCGQIAPRLCYAPRQGLRPFPSARAASRHRSGQQRGSREVLSGTLDQNNK